MQTKSEMINRIAELAKKNAELKAENMEIKISYINFIAKLKREMITKDDIQDLKDTAKRFVEERNSLRKENAELKAENERLKEENYQLQKDCQICENFIDFIPCKPIRDMDYDLQKVIGQRDDYYQTLQEIKDYINAQGIDNTWNMRIQRFKMGILDLITKAEDARLRKKK